MDKQLQFHVQESLQKVTGGNITIQEVKNCMGGDINNSFLLKTNHEDYFIKINASNFFLDV